MSMLSRYKKSGGFSQLLQLLETCGAQKRERFLRMIEEENPAWAEALKKKLLTVDRIFSWDDNTLGEIAIRVNELSLATAFHGLSEEQRSRLVATFSHAQKRRLNDLYEEKKPTPNEVTASLMKILEEVRSMISHGYLRMDKIDPDMVIDDDIEEKLEQAGDMGCFSQSEDENLVELDFSALKVSAPSSSSKAPDVDFEKVKAKVIQLSREVQALKKENALLKEKLQAIKKIC